VAYDRPEPPNNKWAPNIHSAAEEARWLDYLCTTLVPPMSAIAYDCNLQFYFLGLASVGGILVGAIIP
jgi:hypothetical protein